MVLIKQSSLSAGIASQSLDKVSCNTGILLILPHVPPIIRLHDNFHIGNCINLHLSQDKNQVRLGCATKC